MGKHDTFWNTCCSWSKDDCCKVISFDWVDNCVDFFTVASRCWTACNFFQVYVIMYCNATGCCFSYQIRVSRIKKNCMLKGRDFFWFFQDFFKLAAIFKKSKATFCKFKNKTNFSSHGITSTRNICRIICYHPFTAVIWNKSYFVAFFYAKFFKLAGQIQRSAINTFISIQVKFADFIFYCLKYIFRTFWNSFSKQIRNIFS